MSYGNLEFVQCSLVFVVKAENDRVTICDSSSLVPSKAELGLISSTVLDEGLKLARLVCGFRYVCHTAASFGPASEPSKDHVGSGIKGYHSWEHAWRQHGSIGLDQLPDGSLSPETRLIESFYGVQVAISIEATKHI